MCMKPFFFQISVRACTQVQMNTNSYRIVVVLPYRTGVTKERRQTQKSTHAYIHDINMLLWRIAAEIFMESLP